MLFFVELTRLFICVFFCLFEYIPQLSAFDLFVSHLRLSFTSDHAVYCCPHPQGVPTIPDPLPLVSLTKVARATSGVFLQQKTDKLFCHFQTSLVNASAGFYGQS